MQNAVPEGQGAMAAVLGTGCRKDCREVLARSKVCNDRKL